MIHSKRKGKMFHIQNFWNMLWETLAGIWWITCTFSIYFRLSGIQVDSNLSNWLDVVKFIIVIREMGSWTGSLLCKLNEREEKSAHVMWNIIWAASWQTPTRWHVRPAKILISLGIRPVWSESSMSAWWKLGSLATHWVHSEDWAFVGRTLTLFVLSRGGSIRMSSVYVIRKEKFQTERSHQFLCNDLTLTIIPVSNVYVPFIGERLVTQYDSWFDLQLVLCNLTITIMRVCLIKSSLENLQSGCIIFHVLYPWHRWCMKVSRLVGMQSSVNSTELWWKCPLSQ